MTNPTIKETIKLVKWLHQGQTDWEGEEYWKHPVAVMNLLPADATIEEKLTALLHDTLEDVCLHRETGMPVSADDPMARSLAPDDLRGHGYNEAVIANVMMLTRPASTNVLEKTAHAFHNGCQTYLDKIREMVASGNRAVMRVKLADNTHNADVRRRSKLTPARLKRAESIFIKRYQPSMKILRAGLGLSEAD